MCVRVGKQNRFCGAAYSTDAVWETRGQGGSSGREDVEGAEETLHGFRWESSF